MKEYLPFRGILGLGKESTMYYLNQIQEKFKENNESYSTCPFLMYQIDFQEINPFLPDQFSILIPKLKVYFEQISELGITKFLVPNITLHKTLDQIDFPFQICHPVDLTLKELVKRNCSEIILFGTVYTMNSTYMSRKFSGQNIKVSIPSTKDQNEIDDFRKVVFERKETSAEILHFQNLIRKYSEKNPVVIACTELSIYAPKNTFTCIDMADLQIEEFLK